MAARPLLAAFRWRCTFLIRSRSANAALRVVSCRAAAHSLGRGGRPEHSLTLAPGLPGEPGNVGWPRTLRGAPEGHSGGSGRNTTGRPSRASFLSPGNEKQSTGRPTAPPGHLVPLAWLGGEQAVCALPRPRPSRPVGHQKHVSTLRPPFPPSPPSHLIGAAIKRWAAIEIRGEGRTPGALQEGLPPNPPIKERPNYLGGTRPRQGPSLSLEAIRGGGTRRPGYAGTDPPPDPLPANKREGEVAVRCLQANRRLTMSSHEKRVAAHRKPGQLR